MPQTLDEFLVSIRYAVDSASQQSFLSGLENIVRRVSKLGAELIALAAAVDLLTRNMAAAGERLYFMSMRLDEGIGSIEAATYAMTRFGVSTAEAQASLEGMGKFLRTYGPAGQAFMASMGVTATDALGRAQQLTAFFQRMGARPGQETTLGYSFGLKYAQRIGIDENTMRAYGAGTIPQDMIRGLNIGAMIWGLPPGLTPSQQEQQLNKLTAAYGQSAHQVMNVFRDFGAVFSNIWQRFAASFLPQMLPHMQQLFDYVMAHRQDISAALEKFGKALIYMVDGFVRLLQIGGDVVNWWHNLDQGFKESLETIGYIVAGVTALSSRMTLLAGALLLVMGIIADYQAWKRDEAAGQGKEHPHSLWDWSGTEEWLKKFSEVRDSVNKWGEWLTGGKIKDAFDDIIAAIVILGTSKVLSPIKLVTAAFKGLGWAIAAARIAASPLGMAIAGIMAALIAAYVGGKDASKRWGQYLDNPSSSQNPWGPGPNTDDYGNPIITDPDAGKGLLPTDPTTGADVPTGGAGGLLGGLLGGGIMFGRRLLYGPASLGGGQTQGPAAGFDLRDTLMKALGVSAKVAGAMVSNFKIESGFDPTAVNKKSGAFGLAQWLGPRKDRLLKFAMNNGLNPADLSTQIAFLKWELQQYFPGLLAKMEGESNPEQAAYDFFENFEAGWSPILQGDLGSHVSSANYYAGGRPALKPAGAGGSQHSSVDNSKNINVAMNNTMTFGAAGNPRATADAVGHEINRQKEQMLRDLTRTIV